MLPPSVVPGRLRRHRFLAGCLVAASLGCSDETSVSTLAADAVIVATEAADAVATIIALEELEYYVSDMDNARDLHTIGGWSANFTRGRMRPVMPGPSAASTG